MEKDLDMDQDKAGMSEAYLAYAKAEAHRITSAIDKVREWYEGDEVYWRDDVVRNKAVAGRERAKAERLRDILEEE